MSVTYSAGLSINELRRPQIKAPSIKRRVDGVVVDDISPAEWHNVMTGFSDIHYEQTAIFGSGKRRERVSRILLIRDGHVVAGAQVGISTAPIVNTGLALVRFGPFWRSAGTAPDIARYREIVSALVDEYCTRQKLYLIIRPRAHPDVYPLEAQVLNDLGIQGKASSVLDRYMVDVSLSEADQKSSLEHKWRYNLRQAQAAGLDVKIGGSRDDIARFQSMFGEMVTRKNLVYSGMDMVDAMPELSNLPKEMRLQVALAYDRGQAIAGLAFAVVGDVAYYVFGASSDQAPEKKAGYILQWQVIQWLREVGGIRWYELGGPGDAGIRQFKKGLTGKKGAMLPVQDFHYCTSTSARTVVDGMFKLRDLRDKFQKWQRDARAA